jgi:sterol 3beta-glucosyltransferase
MRFCIITYGSRGDIQPFIALALGLAAKGHQVTLAAPGNFESLAVGYGIDIFPLHGNIEELINEPKFRRVIKSGSNIGFVRLMLKEMHDIRGTILDEIYQASKTADVLLVVNTCILYAAAIAEKLNIKWIIIQLNPPMVPTKDFPMVMSNFPDISWLNIYSYHIVNAILWQVQKKDTTEFRRQLGLPPVRGSAFKRILQDKVPMIHAFSPELIPRPRDWDDQITVSGFLTLPAINVVNNQPVIWPDGLIAWLKAGSKPLYIGFGSIPFPDTKRLIDTINGILAVSGTRIIFCLGWSRPDGLPVHPNLFIIKQANHNKLLPECCAAVIHGGIGTIAATLKAGIPAIVAPLFVDQPVWANIIRDKNLGVVIPWRKLSAKSVLNALDQTKQSPVVKAINEVYNRLCKEDGVETAIKTIEEYCK